MAYVKQTWANGSGGATPVNQTRLNYIEQGIFDAHSLATGGNLAGGIYIDSFTGSDDARLTAAISAQQGTAGMPPIILGARNYSFNQTRTLYSGLKLVGAFPSGPKNLEQSPNFVTSRVTLGSSITSGTASWWVSPGANVFDIYMADFAVQGNSGSSVHQFLDFPTSATMYACQFHSLSFNFMRSVFGRKDRICAFTQVMMSGHWTINNTWDTFWNIGGSDNFFPMYLNAGTSQSGSQLGTYADNDYYILFSSLSNTNVGYLYLSMLNGWRGLKITGSGGNGLFIYGGVYEGYKASGTTTGGATLAAPGTCIRIEGGSGAFYGPNVGQGMAAPDPAEGGLIHMTAGEWAFYGVEYYKGSMAESTPCFFHTGGRASIFTALRRQSESWTARPGYKTTSTVGTGANTFYIAGDSSMTAL
jgi:hypothetical protein